MPATKEIAKPTAVDIIERMEQYEADRSNWDNLYQDCADYGLPGDNQITSKQNPGQQKVDTFQTEGENSIIQLAAGLYSYMFPTDSKAFTLKVDDEELGEKDEVKQYLDKVTKIVHQHLVQSTFRQTFFESLKALGCFGTSCLYSEPGRTQPLNYVNFHMAGVYVDIDEDGNIDTVYRNFEYTARQAVKKFGKDKLGSKILTAYENNKQRRKKFKFIHAVEPREGVDGLNKDPLTMDIASYYVSRDDKKIVDESGYPEMPYQVTRFDKDANEILGRSPMMKMLPDVKMLGLMKKTRIKGWEKICDPPIVRPDDGSIWPMATQPGGVINMRPGSEKPFWFEFKGDIAALDEAIKDTTQYIRSGFFLDYFDVLMDRKNMTATEVMARVEKQMRFLTPIIGRLQSELFNPMIKRAIGILGRAKKLPPIPEMLVDVTIEYLGPLALAMKTLETQGFVKSMEDLRGFSEAERMEYLDNIEIDETTRGIFRNNGVPSVWLKDIEKRDAERKAIAKQQQAAALLEQVPGLAKAASDAGKAPEEGSITKGVMNAAA
jgi:hypothetical protein